MEMKGETQVKIDVLKFTLDNFYNMFNAISISRFVFQCCCFNGCSKR
jgi:hypothetical protein